MLLGKGRHECRNQLNYSGCAGDFYFEEYRAHYVEILYEARTLFPELQGITLATANNSWERNHAMLSAGNSCSGRSRSRFVQA